ncbi:MAG: protein kinase domain-containing protein [Planctomycetota bacterium]
MTQESGKEEPSTDPPADSSDPPDGQPASPPSAEMDDDTVLYGSKTLPPTPEAPYRPRKPIKPVLGPYKILVELGHGGMGMVYKAVHMDLKRTVALKVLTAGEDATEDAIARFRREAEAVAKLGHHPHIVPLYDLGRDGQLHYFAMHFVEGKPLDELIRDGELSPRRAAIFAQKIAGALEHAHKHNVLHRDVKPENVLVSPEGEPQVTDFGLAKDTRSDSGLTHAGTLVGTPKYMSPEQAEARLDAVDARSDVYGLGATLYTMLAGVPPFEGPTILHIIKQVLQADPVPLRKRNPAVPRDLETICFKALEKDPARRYASAGELEEDLRRFLENQPIVARRASLTYRVAKRVKRNPGMYITGATATLVLLIAAFFFLGLKPWLDRREERRAERALLQDALDKRAVPLQEVAALLDQAKGAFQEKRWNACARHCERIDAAFGRLQGEKFGAIPPVKHRDLLREKTFQPLQRPYSLPLTEAAVLRARAKEAAGDREGAQSAWARAYWRARQGSGPKEPNSKTEETLREALLALGEDRLANREFLRARGVYEEILARNPEPEGGVGTLGLARAFQGQGEWEKARAAYQTCLQSKTLEKEARVYASDAAALLETVTPAVRFPLPLTPESTRGGIAATAPFDLDGDGREELLILGYDLMLTGVGFSNGKVERKLEQRISTELDWRKPRPWPHLASADLDGDGQRELLVVLGYWNGPRTEILILEWGVQSFRRTASHVERGVGDVVTSAFHDVTGDGSAEIFLCFNTQGHGVGVFSYQNEVLRKVGSFRTGSYPRGLGVGGRLPSGRVLISLGEYSHYFVAAGDLDPGSRAFRLTRERAPFHSLAYDLKPVSGGRRFAFILPRLEAGELPWWIVIESMEDEPEAYLAPGIYRFRTASWPDVRPLPVYAEPGKALIPPWFLAWEEGGRDRFLFHRHLPEEAETELFVGPVGSIRGDWIRIKSHAAPFSSLSLQLDEDRLPEFCLTYRDGTCLTLGWGIRDRAAGFLPRAAGGDEDILSDPTLAIARTLAEMGISDEAARVYAVAAASAQVDAVRGAALLGRADVLVQGGKLEEAIPAYGKALSNPWARGRAVQGKVWALRALGRWKELHAFLEKELGAGHLPPDITVRMRALLKQVTPLARLAPRLRLLERGKLHPGAICIDPLTVKVGAEGVSLSGDASRQTHLLIPVKSTGESFRLEVDFRIDALDWATRINMGLFGTREDSIPGCAGIFLKEKQTVGVRLDPGYATSFPLCQVRPLSPWQGGTLSLLQKYPPRYPAAYRITLEYSREMRFWRQEIRDGEGKVLSEKSMDVTTVLPKGNFFLFLSLSREGIRTHQPRWWPFRTGITVREMTLHTPWEGACIPEVAMGHAEDLLALANGHMAAGRWAEAERRYGQALAAARTEEESASDCLGDLPGWPGLVARILLFRGVLRYRAGEPEKAAVDVTGAIRKDPYAVLYLLMRDFPALTNGEKRFLSARIQDPARAPEGSWIETWAQKLVEMDRIAEREKSEWVSNFLRREAGSQSRNVLLANLLLRAWNNIAFAHDVFLKTPLEANLRTYRLKDIENEAAGKKGGIYDVYALRRWGEFLKAFPEEPRALNGLARFLATCPRKKIRHPDRALDLARRAETIARKAGEPLALARALDTLAAAHFAKGNGGEAIRTQEEALRTVPGGERNFRREMEKRLAEYRRGRGGG